MWLRPDGKEMTDAERNDGERRTLGVLFDGDAIPETDAHGRKLAGDTLLILFTAAADDSPFVLPRRRGARWERLIDTADPDGRSRKLDGGAAFTLVARSAA